MSLADCGNSCYVEDRNAHEVKYDRYPAPPANADFVVHIHVSQTIVPLHLLEEEEEQEEGMLMSNEYDMETLEKSFSTQSDLLIDKDNASCASNISQMLSEVDVPEDVHEDFIQKISIAARRIAVAAAKEGEDDSGGGSNCLTMNVQIEVVVIRPGTEEDDDVNNNDEREELGVSRTAVEVLEKVIVIKEEGDMLLHGCAICLETMEVGSEGIRMPCSHMFHGGCILRWLEKSKRCPYCRFEIWWK